MFLAYRSSPENQSHLPAAQSAILEIFPCVNVELRKQIMKNKNQTIHRN